MRAVLDGHGFIRKKGTAKDLLGAARAAGGEINRGRS